MAKKKPLKIPPADALVRSLAHPLRQRIVREVAARGGEAISPSELAQIVDMPLTHVSYHVRKLASLGVLVLVRKRPKRGVIEHYYGFTSPEVGTAIVGLLAAASALEDARTGAAA